jgi:ABC-type transport system substrate-binding protein
LAEELVARLTQATLVRLNRTTGELEPRLARDWKPSPDGLTWILTLVEGVTFSDGTPFTSADVVFTFQALFDPKVKSEIASSMRIDGKPIQVRALDPATVEIVLPAPYGPGLSMLDSIPILPRHKLAAALEAGTFRDAWGTTTPVSEIVGLGPFVIQEYVPGQKLVFARNPKFWDMDDGGSCRIWTALSCSSCRTRTRKCCGCRPGRSTPSVLRCGSRIWPRFRIWRRRARSHCTSPVTRLRPTCCGST